MMLCSYLKRESYDDVMFKVVEGVKNGEGRRKCIIEDKRRREKG
jgi:hypothetical protein